MSNKLINPIGIKAKVLSVVKNATDPIVCYIEVNDESCNLTLNLDADTVTLGEYPAMWRAWSDFLVGNDELATYESAEIDGGLDSFVDEIEDIVAYVSRSVEKEIYIQLKKSLEVQFQDEGCLSRIKDNEKALILDKLTFTIKQL
jgi:hypothetical protein